MSAAPVLYVGEDVCFRIPVMKKAGLVVCRVPCSPNGVRSAIASTAKFSALIFHLDAAPLAPAVIDAAQPCLSPFVLFDNPIQAYDPRYFDLVIPALTRPETWLLYLQAAIASSRQLREFSQRLREESAVVRLESQTLRAQLHHLLRDPIDVIGMWHGSHPSPSLGPQPQKRAI